MSFIVSTLVITPMCCIIKQIYYKMLQYKMNINPYRRNEFFRKSRLETFIEEKIKNLRFSFIEFSVLETLTHKTLGN